MQFEFNKANGYLPYIGMIAVGLGTANYIINGNFNWIQWIILALSTNLIIGYSLVTISLNKSWFLHHIKLKWKLYFILFLAFFLAGVIATEVEHLIKALIFSDATHQFFAEAKMYLFNGIIALVLGFSFFLNSHVFPNKDADPKQQQETSSMQETKTENKEASTPPINSVPVKHGESILLLAIKDIVYFEAFDNYAFVYDSKGKKRLCDYSLLFLQQRLGENFLRIHRKYIINSSFIKQISPLSNSRFQIEFDAPSLPPIISSKTYTTTVRSLIKLK